MVARASFTTLLLALAITSPSTLGAQTMDDTEPPERVEETELLEEGRAVFEGDRVEWRDEWAPLRWWEYVGAGVLGGGGLVAKFFLPYPEEDAFGGPTPIDQSFYDAARPAGQDVLDAHAIASDVGFYGSMSFLIADALLAGFIHDAWDVSYNMLMIDLEVLSVIAGTLWWPQALGVGRERPGYNTCGQDGHVGIDCDNEEIRYRSWYAGHPATAMAAAGATCVHHGKMPLYGGIGDPLICATMIGVAAATGVHRVVSGRHWVTDTLAGWTIGAAAGWLIPLGLHYGFGDHEDQRAMTTLRILPAFYGGDHPGFVVTSRF